MPAIILALLPMAVSMLTGAIKRIPAIDNTNGQTKRNVIIRSIAAVLSLGGVIGAYMLTGQTPDPSQLSDILTVVALSFATLLGSFGAHEVASK